MVRFGIRSCEVKGKNLRVSLFFIPIRLRERVAASASRGQRGIKGALSIMLASLMLLGWMGPGIQSAHAAPQKKAVAKRTAPASTAKHRKTVAQTKRNPAQKPKSKAPAKRAATASKRPTSKVVHKTAAAKPAAKPAASKLPPPVSYQISSGVQYRRFSRRLASGPVRINLLEIDPKAPGVEIMPVLATGRMGAKTNVADMVSRHQAVAGINGSFFKPDVGIPLGILMINQELISGPIFDRVALGITKDNNLVMDRVHLAGEVILPSGRRLPLHNVNQPRTNAAHTVLYSSRWGTRAPRVPSNGIQVLLRNNRVAAVSTEQPLSIPVDGMVLSGAYSPEMAELASLPANRAVQVNVYTLPDWSGMKHAIGGGPWLVRNGQLYIDLKSQHFSAQGLGHREPRSAVGITQSGKMLLVAVDGRQANSVGMTLTELAQLMRDLGATQAMNLDGGSSTQMAVHGKIVNVPSAGQIGVSNSLVVRQLNTDNMALQENGKAF